jgi:hypothetical protein
MDHYFITPQINQDFAGQLRARVVNELERQMKPRWQWWWVPLSVGVLAMLTLWWMGGQEVKSVQQELGSIDTELSYLEAELAQDQDITNAIEFIRL